MTRVSAIRILLLLSIGVVIVRGQGGSGPGSSSSSTSSSSSSNSSSSSSLSGTQLLGIVFGVVIGGFVLYVIAKYLRRRYCNDIDDDGKSEDAVEDPEKKKSKAPPPIVIPGENNGPEGEPGDPNSPRNMVDAKDGAPLQKLVSDTVQDRSGIPREAVYDAEGEIGSPRSPRSMDIPSKA